jgi:hypothetical protein
MSMLNGLLTVALTALLAQAALSQSIDDVLARHYKARGGLKAIRAVNTVSITGTLKMMGREFNLSIVHKRPNAVRTEYGFQGTSFVEAFDGTAGWQINPMMGSAAPSELKGEELASLKDLADMDGPLVDWKAKGYTPLLLGKEEVNGKSAFHVKVMRDTACIREEFLDAVTYLVIQERTRERVRGQAYDIVTSFQQYKKVKGLSLPFRQIVTGPMPQEMRFQKIVLDAALPDSIFSKPPGK